MNIEKSKVIVLSGSRNVQLEYLTRCAPAVERCEIVLVGERM